MASSLVLLKLKREATRLDKVLSVSGRALVAVMRDRTIDFATKSALRWMQHYFDNPRSADRLPEVLDLWVRQHDSGVRKTLKLPWPPDPLVVDRSDRRLVVKFISGNEEILLLLEEQKTLIDPGSLSSLGLTRREGEVLAHIANGFSKARIAKLLGTSPRTVDSHVRNIMESLNVSSSTAAAAKAFQASRLDSHNFPNSEEAQFRERSLRVTEKSASRI